MSESEEEWTALLRSANAGDAAAYRAFLDRIAPVLRGIVHTRGRHLGPETCEDILQETLLAIHAKRHTWNPDSPVRPWLYAIARHKVVDAFRRRGSRIDLPIEDFADTLPAPEADGATLRRDALRLIGRLDDRSAALVTAIGIEGRDAAEVGAALSMSDGAVRVALHRALKRLAALYKDETG